MNNLIYLLPSKLNPRVCEVVGEKSSTSRNNNVVERFECAIFYNFVRVIELLFLQDCLLR